MRVSARRMICHRNGPRMAASRLARASLERRHRDGLAALRFVSRGGRVRDLPGAPFGDQEDDQPCVDPCASKFWLLGCQCIEAGKALHPLEGEFELPAEAIEREHIGRREDAGRQRREEQDVLGGLQTARVELLAALLGFLEKTSVLGFHLLRALAPSDEPQDQRRAEVSAFINTNAGLALLLSLRSKRREEIERGAIRMQQTQRIPSGA